MCASFELLIFIVVIGIEGKKDALWLLDETLETCSFKSQTTFTSRLTARTYAMH